MSDTENAGFGKFVPGFDFLQNLAKGASASVPQMPNLGSWVAPTLNVEELDKRIGELKNVQFWLEQNSRALSATIQALEVQKMTLATLKGMNFNLSEVANAFKLKTADTVASSVNKPAEAPKPKAEAAGDGAGGASKTADKAADAAPSAVVGAGLVDPLQLWGALTTQFQQIAATAMKEVTTKTAASLGAGLAKGAAASKKTAAKKAPAKKAAAKTTRK